MKYFFALSILVSALLNAVAAAASSPPDYKEFLSSGECKRGCDFSNSDFVAELTRLRAEWPPNVRRRSTGVLEIVGGKLDGARFGGSKIEGIIFSRTSFLEASFEGARLKDVEFVGASLRRVNFTRSSWANVNLLPYLSSAGLVQEKTDVSNGVFEHLSLGKSRWVSVLGAGSAMFRHIANTSDLFDIRFVDMDFSGAEFYKVNLSKIACSGCKFSETLMRDVGFELANLENADFTGADVTSVSFREARLVGTNFGMTKFSRVDFTSSVFEIDPKVMPIFANGRLSVSGLREVYVPESVEGIKKVRASAREIGLEQLSRDLTFAIGKNRTDELIGSKKWLDGAYGYFRLVAFEWLLGYGSDLERGIFVSVLVFILFIIVFSIVISIGVGFLGRIEIKRVDEELSDAERKSVVLVRGFPKSVYWAVYFSALAFFSIGPGKKITELIERALPWGVSLKAFGVVRTLTAVEALLGWSVLSIIVLGAVEKLPE